MSFVGKKILILGANPETTSLVLQANRMGIRTIVTDYNLKAQAKKYAWKKYDIDASDIEHIVSMAQDERIDGIVLGVAEALMPAYLEVCDRLNLSCYGNAEIFRTLTRKDLFKKLCGLHDVPAVEQYDYSPDATDHDYSNVRFPIVVKPIDSCSSKGIFICKDVQQLESSIKKSLDFSRSGNVLLEKYMTGDEVVIYYTFQNGEVILNSMCDRYTNKDQAGVAQLPTAYIYPSRYLTDYERTVNGKVIDMLRSIGVQNGTMFIQSFIEDGQVRFYESGYRLNGAQEHLLVSRESGINMLESMINFALTGSMSDIDLRMVANPHFNHICCKLSPLVTTGCIAKIDGLERIERLPGVVSVNPSYGEGEEVSGYGTLKQIIARFYIISENKHVLANTISEIYALLDVRDEKKENMLLKPFDTDILLRNYP